MSQKRKAQSTYGPTSWAEAVYLKSISDKQYAAVVFNRFLKKYNLDETIYQIRPGWKKCSFLRAGRLVARLSYREISLFRQEGTDIFGLFLEHEMPKDFLVHSDMASFYW